MWTRAIRATGLSSFNFVCQNTKSQILAILDLKNGDFDKLYLHLGPVGTRGDIMLGTGILCVLVCTTRASECA
jgi:hypothetical protein